MPSPQKKHKSAPKTASSGRNFGPHRRIFVFLAAVFILAGAVWLTRLKGPKLDFSNLLIISLDTTRADRIGAYGYRDAESPRLDAIAGDGIVFETAYAPVPLTLPSHCSLFTGTYPLYHGVRNHGSYFLSSELTTLAEIFKDHGVQTAAFVSSFVLDSRFGLDQGFDLYEDRFGDSEKLKLYTSERRAEATYAAFEDWFQKARRGPFFAWVHFFDPHYPYSPPEPYLTRFADHPYDGEIAYMDRYVGAVYDTLKTAGQLDKTLLVIIGDHGEAFGEHGYVGHQIFCYQEELKIPFIIHAHHQFKPRRVSQAASLVDLVPTILDIWDYEIPAHVQGSSLLSALKGHEKKPGRFYFESFYPLESMGCAPVQGLIRDNYKYIDLPQPELYDLEKDRLEKDNRIDGNPELAGELKHELSDFVSTHAQQSISSQRTLSGEERRRLSSLGYVAGSGSRAVDKNLPDPKDKIAAFSEYTLAKTLEDEGRPADAVRRYRTSIAMNPSFGTAYGKLGDLYAAMGSSEEALKTYEQGIAASPQETFLKTQYAALLLKLGRTDQASAVVDELERERPRDFLVEIYLLAADIKERQGQLDRAIAYCQHAQAVEPENLGLVKRTILLLNAQKRWEDSLPLYRVLEKNNPEDAEVLTDMALVFAKMGDYDAAEVYFQKALALSHDVNLYFNYALLLDRKGRVREALDQMKKFLSLVDAKHPKRQLALTAIKDFESRL